MCWLIFTQTCDFSIDNLQNILWTRNQRIVWCSDSCDYQTGLLIDVTHWPPSKHPTKGDKKAAINLTCLYSPSQTSFFFCVFVFFFLVACTFLLSFTLLLIIYARACLCVFRGIYLIYSLWSGWEMEQDFYCLTVLSVTPWLKDLGPGSWSQLLTSALTDTIIHQKVNVVVEVVVVIVLDSLSLSPLQEEGQECTLQRLSIIVITHWHKSV